MGGLWFAASCLFGVLLSIQTLLAQDSSTSTPIGSKASDQLSLSDDKDMKGMWEAILSMPNAHQGAISYQDVDQRLIHKYGCIKEKYSEFEAAKTDVFHVKRVLAKLRCQNGVHIDYAGDLRTQPGRISSYEVRFYWEPRSSCVRADRALKTIAASDWTIVVPTVSQFPDPPRSSDDIPNHQAYTSNASGHLTFDFVWAPEQQEMIFSGYPAEKSCVRIASLELRAP
jgi:hypothetical protein